MIAENLSQIHKKIAEACIAAGRKPEEVQLIAVSKTKPLDLIQEALDSGQLIFGENRVQELREKHPALPQAKWHMIGKLQRNKVKFIAPFIDLIHSVDSARLLKEINRQAQLHQRQVACLLQLNISDETAKSGMDEKEAREILLQIIDYPNIEIKGLMGMAAFVSDRDLIRSQFKRLAESAADLRQIEHSRINLSELSMGMSGDYDIAIAEGATMIRVGSAIFGHR